MPYFTIKIKRFPRLPMAVAVLVCALLLLFVPVVQATSIDHAWLSVSIDTLIHDELRWRPESVVSLNRFFHQRAADFGDTLAERLRRMRPNLTFRLLPTAPDAALWQLRDNGKKNSLLIAVDIKFAYVPVAADDSPRLTARSSFWTARSAMPLFSLRSEATLSAVLFDDNGQRQSLFAELNIPLEEHVDNDFFASGENAEKWDILTGLADKLLPRLINRSIIELGRIPVELSSAREPTVAAFPFLARVNSDQGQGSAFVISRRGFAVTSLHVVQDAEWLTLKWCNGNPLAAFVVERLPQYDLAVVSFPRRHEEPAEFGDDSGLTSASILNAIGFPGATPEVTTARYLGQEKHQQTEIIRISAPLEPGYSGGPLLDIQGRVVGMTISRDSSQPNTGYVIPATTLRKVIAPWRDFPRAPWARTQDGGLNGKIPPEEKLQESSGGRI
ncbi:MAG: serine protease [Desulfuromonadales bacterium]|nr:serine protease [Desulfuromonadales bacterium]